MPLTLNKYSHKPLLIAFLVIGILHTLALEAINAPKVSIYAAAELEWEHEGKLFISDDAENWEEVDTVGSAGGKNYWLTTIRNDAMPKWIKFSNELKEDENGNALVIEINKGTRRVSVQMRNSTTGEWEEHSMAHLDGSKGTFAFDMPEDIPLDDIKELNRIQRRKNCRKNY